MRLGILSDTHNEHALTEAAVRLLVEGGAEALVHCGDLTGPEIIRICSALPFYFTFGNHDSDNVPALHAAVEETGAACLGWGGEITLAGKRIAVCHGHMRSDLKPLLATLPDYLLSGHSHMFEDRVEGVTRRINPGALYRTDQATVALLDLGKAELVCIRVASASHRHS